MFWRESRHNTWRSENLTGDAGSPDPVLSPILQKSELIQEVKPLVQVLQLREASSPPSSLRYLMLCQRLSSSLLVQCQPYHSFHLLLVLEFAKTVRPGKYENKYNTLLRALHTTQQQLSQECFAYGVKILFVLS